MSAVVTVVVADDHPVVRTGLTLALAADPGIEIVGQAATGVEAVQCARDLRPDVILMDLQMPELDGVGATKEINAAELPTRVLILTTYDTDRSIVAAVEAGAAGYLLKDAPMTDLVAAVKTAAAGGSVLPEPIAAKLDAARRAPQMPELTEREIEVLSCIARGASNAKAATELFISVATVKTHLIHAFQKLQVEDRTAAVTKALELGLIDSTAKHP